MTPAAVPAADAAVPARARWREAEPLECVRVLPEAPDTASFTFQAPSGAVFDHRPGQFVTLELPLPGGAVHRSYTISSPPSRPLTLCVTVRAQPGSLGSRWMLEHLRPGMRLRARGPAGVFCLPDPPEGKFLFISAGSGITPMMAMTTHLHDTGRPADIVLVNCARRPSEIIFRARLEQMAARFAGLKLAWVVREPDPFAAWTGYTGRFNQLMLGLMAPDYLEREVYCCGPEGFMQAVREALVGLGFDMARYHQESFAAPAPAGRPQPQDVTPDDRGAAYLEFALSGRGARCAQTDTVLLGARAAGVVIPSGCGFGVCGTCKIRKTAGQVHMVHNGGITQDDIDAGYILACCSHPIGRVTIEA